MASEIISFITILSVKDGIDFQYNFLSSSPSGVKIEIVTDLKMFCMNLMLT